MRGVGVVRTLLALGFFVLFGFKVLMALNDPSSPNTELIGSLMFGLIFGAPQLIWMGISLKPRVGRAQIAITVGVFVLYVLASVMFGSMPGVGRPKWGGTGHFEVPAALLVEGFIALVAGMIWLAAARKRARADAAA